MFIGKVVGNIWSTRKHAQLNNLKLLLVKPISKDGKFSGATTLAVDQNLGAGIGSTVLVVDEGGSAKKMLNNPKAPIRTIICGIVD
jgi:ethanolamine utilization protein EutN